MAYGPSKRNNQTWVFTTLDADSRILNFKYFSTTDDGFTGSGTRNLAIMTSSRYAQTQVTQDHDKCSAQKFMMKQNDWRDVEITGQIKFVDAMMEGAKVNVFARSGDITRPCEGTGYGVQLSPDGIVRCMLRQWYPGGEMELDSSSGTAGDIEDKWIGFKVCIYNDQTDQHVIIEAWIDENNNNQFQKVCSTTDTGMGNAGERCGTNPNEVITWGGPLVVLNLVDCGDVFFRYLSVREIDPFNRFGMGGGVSGEGFEIVNDITTLEYLKGADDTFVSEGNIHSFNNISSPHMFATGPYAAGDVDKTLYKLTGRTQKVTIEGYKTRHYASGKPDDITREANTANGCPFENYEVTGYFTIDDIDHDDTISFKMYGPSHDDGIGQWYISDLKFNSGQNLMGYEEPHPHTTMDIESSTSIGSIVGKKIGYKTVIWKVGSGANVQAWADKGDGLWMLIHEVESPDGKHFSPDPDQKVQIRIDAAHNITYWGTPTVKEITPGGEFVGTDGTGTGSGSGTINWTDINNYDKIGGIDTADNAFTTLSSSTNDAVAIQIVNSSSGIGAAIINKPVQAIEYWAKGVNTPTGSVTGVIWDASGNEVYRNAAPFNATSYGTATAVHHFYQHESGADLLVQVGWRIGFEYTTGTGSDEVDIQRSSASIDSSAVMSTRPAGGSSSSWVTDTAHDMRIGIYQAKDFSGGSGDPGGPVDTSPIFPTPPSHGMIDHGGPKWTNATIHLLFWGADWNTRTSPYSKVQVVNSLTAIFNSRYFDPLIQYGIKRPKLGKNATNSTFAIPSTGYTRTGVYNFIKDCIAKGLVPENPPGQQNGYLVFPPFNAIADPAGGAIGTYHESDVYPYTATSVVHVLGLIEYRPTLLTPYTNTLDIAIVCATHEIVEMLTAPVYSTPSGVTGDPTVFSDTFLEISDVCQAADTADQPRAAGQRVAYYWSNQDGRCIGEDIPPSWTSCHIGAEWDPVNQQCVRVAGTGGLPVDTSTIFAPRVTDWIIDYGGPKWSSAVCHFIFSGSTWNTITSPFSRQNVIDMINAMFGSKYFDYLLQYDIYRPTLGKIITNTTTTIPNHFEDTDLTDTIKDSISRGNLPGPSAAAHHLYMVIIRPGIVPSDTPAPSGYHYSSLPSSVPVGIDPISLAYVAGMGLTNSGFDGLTDTISHEVVEMITDPITNTGYNALRGNDSKIPEPGYNELSDICDNESNDRIGGFLVEPYYSDADGACVAPTTDPPWVSCHEHAIWNPVTQSCEADPSYNPEAEGIPEWGEIGDGGTGGSDPGTGGGGGIFGGDVWEKAYTGGLGHLLGAFQGKVAASGSVTGYVTGNITGVSGDSLATFAGTFNGTTPGGISGQVSGNVAGTGTGTGNSSNGNKTGEFVCDVTGTVIGIDSGSGAGNIAGRVTGSFTAINVVEVSDPGTGTGTGSGGTGSTGGGGTESGTPTPTPDPTTTSPTFAESSLQLLWAIDSMEGDPCSINSPTEDTSLQEIFNAAPDNLYAETLNYRRVGIYVNKISSVFVGRKIRNVKVIMQRVGAQPLRGLVFCRIRASNRTIVEEFPDTIDSSLITETDVTYEFTHSSPQRDIERGDFIYIEYPSGGDTSNYLRIKLSDTDKADGEASCLVTFDGVNEVINIDKDCALIVST